MPLDPTIAQLLEMGRDLPKMRDMSIADARASMLARVAPLAPLAPADVATHDLSITTGSGPLPIRLYRPQGSEGPLPVVVWLHGGGWVVGDIESHDGLCRYLAKAGPLLVVSVDYRLAPEARSPAQQQDTLAALHWTAANIATHGGNPERIIVGGDSAGGNLAALAAIAIRDFGGPKLAGQLLVYPVTDYPTDSRASYAPDADYGLSKEDMEWFWNLWLAEGDPVDASTAPLRAENLSNLPPAYVVTAEFDVLKDEGDEYAAALSAAGTKVTHDCVPGAIHGFFSIAAMVPIAADAIQRAGRWAASV